MRIKTISIHASTCERFYLTVVTANSFINDVACLCRYKSIGVDAYGRARLNKCLTRINSAQLRRRVISISQKLCVVQKASESCASIICDSDFTISDSKTMAFRQLTHDDHIYR